MDAARPRVLVCMSPYAHADAPLLAGAALAEQLHAEWFAIAVMSTPGGAPWRGRRVSDALTHNARLAETLGARVSLLTADDAPAAAIAFAEDHDVTHAVFGHDPTSSRSILAEGSFVQRFSTSVRGLEVQVVKST